MGTSKSGIISKSINVVFRKVNFGFGKSTKKHWHNDSPFITYFWSALSTAFPDGELFFMDAGRYYEDQIKDPVLKQQFKDFIRQEAHHTHQHNKMNAMTREQGFDMDKYQNWFLNIIDIMRAKTTPKTQLGISIALEHFTANFGSHYLTRESLSKGADPEMKALWSWHATEEIEHKGVLFDVYNEIKGDYFTRVTTMPIAWFGILAVTFVALYDMLKQDDRLFDVKDNIKGIAYILTFLAVGTPEFVRYFKPGFHPWDNDNKYLIEEWYAKNSHYVINKLKVA
ncbi:MAG: hypothetical protein COA42_15720 [Alteromonadaceae bacterium]|nr:MAG: hypothetical protein COA42_15720 [Alteromonadaceae bacterium]